MRNALIELIRDGKIRSPGDLKKIYRKMVLQTHPDAIGSTILLESYLEIRRHYEEAERYLVDHGVKKAHGDNGSPVNSRLGFFKEWDVIETLEMPYAFPPEENKRKLAEAKQAAFTMLATWRPEWKELYKSVDEDSVRMKHGIPLGPYLKHAMALNVRPLAHNIIYFHLTGRTIYARQAKQNFAAIMYRLEQEGFGALREFLVLLVEDVQNGPAILE